MASQALYNRWRPQLFDEVVGQEHVVRTLRNALTGGRIQHAYLFTGPRGTGKTTSARLLAKAVNCLETDEARRPCNQCDICQAVNEGRLIDLIEIDAASNTGVDDVRDLRDKVGFRPNQARYKVYVIDEVHMLSNPAFNALLKTLEEPPPHALFILATTEAHKIPATVVSRCQRFDFHRIPVGQMAQRLRTIAERENIAADDQALELIARHATGGMRDAISLLDQLASYGSERLSVQQVRDALGSSADEAVAALVDALQQSDLARGLALINETVDRGVDPRQFARQVVEHLRAVLLLRTGSQSLPVYLPPEALPALREQAQRFETPRLARAVRLFNQAAGESHGEWQPQLPLEMAFAEAVLSAQAVPEPAAPPRLAPAPTGKPQVAGTAPAAARPVAPLAAPPEERAEVPPANAPVQPAAAPSGKAAQAAPGKRAPRPAPDTGRETAAPAAREALPAYQGDLLGTVVARWEELLRIMRARNLSLEALLRSGTPAAVDGDCVVLNFSHKFHKEKVEEDRNKRSIEDALEDLLGQRMRVRCQLGPVVPAAPAKARAPEPSPGEALEDPVLRTAVSLGGRIVKPES